MFILLPPSEGKAASPRSGRRLDLDGLSMPGLTPDRNKVLTALESLARGPRQQAVEALGLTPGLSHEVDKDAHLRTAPTLPAGRLYTGVLYDALDLPSLDAAAKRRATRRILVASALFGSLQLDDRVPSYRLSMAARLPRLGTLASLWKAPLAEAMKQRLGDGAVLDLRSGPYAAMWRPGRTDAQRVVAARILHEARPGDPTSRAVVSHFNKATKGRLVRDLVSDPRQPRSTDEVIDLLRDLGWAVEVAPAADGRPRSIDVIVSDL